MKPYPKPIPFIPPTSKTNCNKCSRTELSCNIKKTCYPVNAKDCPKFHEKINEDSKMD